MSTELEDLRQRVEQLERQMHQLELRLSYDDVRHQILYAVRVPTMAADGQPGDLTDQQEEEATSQDRNVGRLETMVRSILINQGEHTTELRRGLRYLEMLVKRELR
jgi:hypothetical protein